VRHPGLDPGPKIITALPIHDVGQKLTSNEVFYPLVFR